MTYVTIYTRMMCGYCAAAKRLLDSKGRWTFPQIFIGEVHVGGSDELHALDASGKLDALLAEGRPN